MSDVNDHTGLVTALKQGEPKAFEAIYNSLSGRLLSYTYVRTGSKAVSEDIVHEVFISLWDKREKLDIEISLEGWLYGAAKNQILNHMRSKEVRRKYATELVQFLTERIKAGPEVLLEAADLQALMDSRVEGLPKRCREAFQKSRYEHKSIQQIADEMNISARTVENYLTKALGHLRKSLELFFWMIILHHLF